MNIVDTEALAALWDGWLAYAWLLGPAFFTALVALAARFAIAKRAERAFDQEGQGVWLDGSHVVTATLRGPTSHGWMQLGVARTRKQNARPGHSSPVLPFDLELVTSSGTTVRVPQGTTVQLGSAVADKFRYEKVAGSLGHEHKIELKEGARLWLCATLTSNAAHGPMRSAGELVVDSSRPVQLAFSEAPSPPETSLGGSYALCWFTALMNVWVASAEGSSLNVALFLTVLFTGLSFESLLRTKNHHKALAAQGR